MERSRSSRIIKSGSALLAVVIIVVVILLINQKRRIDEHHEAVLKESIDINAAYDTRIDGFFKYADVKARERGKVLEARRSDLERYSAEEYGMAHLSMWDVSGLSSDKYTELFGIRAQYADYLYENPLELKEYLSTILDSGNSIVHLYINIDPYILEKNYYDATTYDKEAVSFEEYIHEEIFPILDAHPDVRFEFFLPAFPTSYWASIPISDYSTIIEKWYEFLMYLHWCPNAEVRYMGDVEWLVSNDLNYVSEKRLKDDVMQKVYIYLYAYIQYDVTPPELKQKKGSLDKYIRKYINGEYDICDLSGQKVVFLGDSLFDYISADSVAVPGVVERMTKADCYNLSMGGTTMSAIDELGFTRVANSLAMKSALDHDSRYKREAERFLKNYTDDDELTFVILYGMNDYFSNVPNNQQELELRQPVGTASDDEEEEAHEVEYNADSTFINSLKYGVDCLKKAYPNAEIVLLSPYYPLANNGGTTPFVEGGHTLTEYMKAIEETAKSEAVTFYDLYHKGTINKSNTSTYLEGGVHTNETGAFAVGEDIARFLGETE